MNKKSSTFFGKHTKYCTFIIFVHNIYSHKDILLQELQNGAGLLRSNEFFLYLTRKQAERKSFFTHPVAFKNGENGLQHA